MSRFAEVEIKFVSAIFSARIPPLTLRLGLRYLTTYARQTLIEPCPKVPACLNGAQNNSPPESFIGVSNYNKNIKDGA